MPDGPNLRLGIPTASNFDFPENPNLPARLLHSGGKFKMKRVLSRICCLALCCLTASAEKKPTMTDQQFVNFVAQTDMLEAHLGQMVADHAASQEVKDYASMLVTDHTADYQNLTVLAAKDGFTIPTGLDAAHNKMIEPFDKLKGAAFDSRYIHTMIAGHTEAIETFTKEAADAQNADLKADASATLPTLHKHLDGAKAIDSKASKK